MSVKLLLLLSFGLAAYLTGVIWLVQLVHYPSFAQVPPAAFRAFHQSHLARMGWVVMAPMVAELALFEQARLEGKVLRRPDRALLRLEAYRQRFPQGSLRAEVMLARLDWLLASGDRAGARRAVQEALDSGLLHERSAELQRLRATLEDASQPEPKK